MKSDDAFAHRQEITVARKRFRTSSRDPDFYLYRGRPWLITNVGSACVAKGQSVERNRDPALAITEAGRASVVTRSANKPAHQPE